MGTGKKRIQIGPISDIARRRVTFTKRRQGLFKKIDKLQSLTGCAAFSVIFSPAGRPFTFGDDDLLEPLGSSSNGGGFGECRASYAGNGGGFGGECSASYAGNGGGLELGYPVEVSDLYQFMAEMTALVEIKQSVAERLNREVDGQGSVDQFMQPLRIVQAPPLLINYPAIDTHPSY